MRKPHLSSAALLLALAINVGCAKCGGAPKVAVPADRFVAGGAAAVLVVPSLATFAQQASDLLATAGTFPGGSDLLDARAVIGNRLTFDPFDAVSIAGTGLDPARGLSLSGVVGERGEENPDVLLTLPIGDGSKFEAAVARLAKERLDAPDRKIEPGAPEVISWSMAGGGPALFSYAVVEQTALIAFGPAASATIRAAAAVPAAGSIAGVPGYQKSMKALGDGLALRFYVPAGSPALKEVPQLKEGIAAGVRAARDRIGVAVAMLLGEREAGIKAAAARGESAALLAKLDPGAALVARGDGDPGQSTDVQAMTEALTNGGFPPPLLDLFKDVITSLGSGSAMGIGLLPPGDARAPLAAAPFGAFRAEILATVKDPPRLTTAIQTALDMVAEQAGPPPPPRGKKARKGAKLDLGKNPWRFALPGGEIAAAVADGKLALVAGPVGALEALLARSGTAFSPPTAASAKALQSGTGGMFIDVPRLAAAAKAYPESSFGAGAEGAMVKSMIDQWSASAARITAISVSSELVEGAARGELLVEVQPTAPAAAKPER